MTSVGRIEANRRNALLSTGPRTDVGKAIVARNAMRPGLRARQVLITGESEVEFDAFREAMAEYYEPVGVLEGELVDGITIALWRLKRGNGSKLSYWNISASQLTGRDTNCLPS